MHISLLKHRFTLVLIALTHFGFSQVDSTYFIQPLWEIGDTKEVRLATVNYMYLDDSLISSEQTSDLYYLEVIDKEKEAYILSFKEDKTNLKEREIELKSTLDSVLLLILTEVDQQLIEINYTFEIDTSNAKVIRLKHQRVYIEAVKSATEKTITKYSNVFEKLEKDPDIMLSNVRAFYLNNAAQSVLDVQNKLIHLLSAYHDPLSVDSVQTNEVMIDKLTVFEAMDNLQLPGSIKTEVESNSHTINVSRTTSYDKENFLKKMKGVSTAFGEIQPEQLILIERNNRSFDKNNHWIKKHNADFLMAIPGIKIVRVETITFD